MHGFKEVEMSIRSADTSGVKARRAVARMVVGTMLSECNMVAATGDDAGFYCCCGERSEATFTHEPPDNPKLLRMCAKEVSLSW